MKLSFKTILPIILISALLILLAGCVLPDESPGYTPGAISGTIARPEVCCGEPSESSLVGNAISPNICDVLTLCDPQNTADWYAWANVEVTLTTWVDCEEVELASTITDENGDYLFSNVPAGKNYIITAICPEEIDFKVKDVAEEVVAGETYDAGIADAESTVLALCLEGLGEICLDSDVLDLDDFRDHFKYNKVICEVCDKLAECLYAMPVWVCEITELCPGYTSTGDDDGDDDDDDACPDPTANAGPDQSEEVCPGADALVDLVGSGTGTGPLSYSWDYGDGGSTEDSTEQSPQDVPFGAAGSPYTVTLTVKDVCGSKTDTATVTITECINTAPVIDNLPAIDQKVDKDQTYTYDVDATDIDEDTLTYSLTTKPNGMTIDSLTGEITWPGANCPGTTELGLVLTKGDRCRKLCDIPVTVRVTDDGCCGPLFDEESFIVEVWLP